MGREALAQRQTHQRHIGAGRSEPGHHVCEWCLGSYVSSRRTWRRFCSRACRDAFHRAVRGDLPLWLVRTGQATHPRPERCRSERHAGSSMRLVTLQGRVTWQCAMCVRECRDRVNARLDSQRPRCACGCGLGTVSRSGYRPSHRPEVEPEPLPECLCGCGVRTRAASGYAHYVRNSRFPLVECGCGCGEMTYARAGFRVGHGTSWWPLAEQPEALAQFHRERKRQEMARIRTEARAMREIATHMGIELPALPKGKDRRRRALAAAFRALEADLDPGV